MSSLATTIVGAHRRRQERPNAGRYGSRFGLCLTVPGLGNSGPTHWQSRWDDIFGFRRVELPDWNSPSRRDWVAALDDAIQEAPEDLTLIGHSLGCLAIASWAATASRALTAKVRGAMLVAPPDVGQQGADLRLLRFAPVPAIALPFRSVVVASEDDQYASLARANALAAIWGSAFVNAGRRGHLNAASGLEAWEDGQALLAELVR